MLRVTVGRLTDKACKAFVAQKAHGKEKTYSIGSYPAVSLAAARIDLAEVKIQLRENKDPVTQRRFNRAESSAASDNTFEAIAANG